MGRSKGKRSGEGIGHVCGADRCAYLMNILCAERTRACMDDLSLQRLLLFSCSTNYLARVCYISSFWGGRLGIKFFFLGGETRMENIMIVLSERARCDMCLRGRGGNRTLCGRHAKGRLGVRLGVLGGFVVGTARPGTRSSRVVSGVGDVKVGRSIG